MIEKSLAGPIGVFVKFSTLQDYGVDKVFFLENDNVDASQKNVIFLARGEKANQPIAVAGMYVLNFHSLIYTVHFLIGAFLRFSSLEWPVGPTGWDHKVDCVDTLPLYLISLDPNMNENHISSSIYSVILRWQ